jgi:hypothetical protein
MALGLIKPPSEINTKNLPGGKGRLAPKADNFIATCEPIFYKIWEPRRLTALWASPRVTGIVLPVYLLCIQASMM